MLKETLDFHANTTPSHEGRKRSMNITKSGLNPYECQLTKFIATEVDPDAVFTPEEDTRVDHTKFNAFAHMLEVSLPPKTGCLQWFELLLALLVQILKRKVELDGKAMKSGIYRTPLHILLRDYFSEHGETSGETSDYIYHLINVSLLFAGSSDRAGIFARLLGVAPAQGDIFSSHISNCFISVLRSFLVLWGDDLSKIMDDVFANYDESQCLISRATAVQTLIGAGSGVDLHSPATWTSNPLAPYLDTHAVIHMCDHIQCNMDIMLGSADGESEDRARAETGAEYESAFRCEDSGIPIWQYFQFVLDHILEAATRHGLLLARNFRLFADEEMSEGPLSFPTFSRLLEACMGHDVVIAVAKREKLELFHFVLAALKRADSLSHSPDHVFAQCCMYANPMMPDNLLTFPRDCRDYWKAEHETI